MTVDGLVAVMLVVAMLLAAWRRNVPGAANCLAWIIILAIARPIARHHPIIGDLIGVVVLGVATLLGFAGWRRQIIADQPAVDAALAAAPVVAERRRQAAKP
jgi:hypothetical protein